MANIPHISQVRPPRPPLRPLHHLNRLDIRTVNLNPHLHPHHEQLIPQQNPRVDAPTLDTEADAGKGVAGLEGDEEDVADERDVRVVRGEEAGAGARGVELSEVVGLPVGHGKGVGGAVGGGRGVGFDFLEGCWGEG